MLEQMISIHALRGEGDEVCPLVFDAFGISIHALRGEGDLSERVKMLEHKNFNPRPPWGGRRQSLTLSALTIDFNPRPPWGGRQDSRQRY